jgi:hypothetical protein
MSFIKSDINPSDLTKRIPIPLCHLEEKAAPNGEIEISLFIYPRRLMVDDAVNDDNSG